MIKEQFSMCQISMKMSRWALRMHICGKMPLCSIAFAEKWSEAQMGGRV